MLDWITDIWTTVTEVFTTVCSTIDDLIVKIDGVTFSENDAIFQFWGAVRYVLGEPLYWLLVSSITIGAGFMIYKLTVQVFEIIKSLIPGLSGKLNFR
jgi:hypothetical protein